ncbi:MAG TPA: histone H1 [Thermoanaerobaculia bacterium]|nr:histone H1 [Thermoanaerobaculia bacterium]
MRPRRPRDPNELAFQVFQEAIGEAPRQTPEEDTTPAAIAKRKGAAKGGKRRASKLTPERRREIAEKAARKRWGKNEDTA